MKEVVMQHVTLPPERLIRQPEVLRRIGISKSTLWSWVGTGRFPAPVKLGPRAVAWSENAVQSWIAERIEAGKGGDHDAR
jgi:prophage regulatory protein